MPAESPQPYLSIVVTSRNDNHGGDLNSRTQAFVDSVAEQCRRHKLRVELLFVEWNPPSDRGPLADELHWPDSDGWCSYRFVTVPREVHLRLACGDKLPLYQMLAKNVGIRRARGEFIVATNVDLIFSNELAAYLAKQRLKPGRYYRTDRYDVPMDVMDLDIADEQLAFCRNNLLRVHTKYGTIDGQACLASGSVRRARWKGYWQRVRRAFSDQEAGRLARRGKRALLPFRVGNALLDISPRRVARLSWRLARLSWRAGRKTLRMGHRIAPRYAGLAFQGATSATKFLFSPAQWSRAGQASADGFKRRLRAWTNPLDRMHTNGCGDFTLMSRADWDRLRGYAELEIFSWHLDSLLIYSAYHSGMLEVLIPHALYHIEHRGGWTPESADGLWKRLREKEIPFLTNVDLDLLHEKIRDEREIYEFNDKNWGMAKLNLPVQEILPNAVPATEKSPAARAA